MNEVKVKILKVPGLELPIYKYEGDAGMDICSDEDIIILPGQTVKLKTNISVELPEGYAFEVSPRSGIDTYTKLRVRLGTIDCQYRGQIAVTIDNISQVGLAQVVDAKFMEDDCEYVELNGLYSEVRSCGDTDPDFHGVYQINKGDRIAQLKLKVVPKCVWEIVDELSESDRGNGGFGHTGVFDDGWDPDDDPLRDDSDDPDDPEYLESLEDDQDEDDEEVNISLDGRNLTKKNGYLIDYDTKYSAELKVDPNKIVKGYLCFSEFFEEFSGLLSEDEVAIYDIDEDSLSVVDNNE